MRESLRPHARIDAATEYGYLFWLREFGGRWPAFYTNGNGGNKVIGVPSLDLAAVITSTNFNTAGMHAATEKLLAEYVLPAAAADP